MLLKSSPQPQNKRGMKASKNGIFASRVYLAITPDGTAFMLLDIDIRRQRQQMLNNAK